MVSILPLHFKFVNRFRRNTSIQFTIYQRIMSTKRVSTAKADSAPKKQKTAGHWALGLLDSMKDPASIVQEDDLVVTIKDRYPKAQFHYLVIPKENISSLKAVTSKHEDLLKHMEEVGEKLAKDDKHNGKKFKLGYHAEASMVRLHLHVISDDMKSECLKTKKHWNSFTSEFFLDSKEVREQLETNGKITLPSSEACKKLMNTPLKCHKCEFMPKNMPHLKRHIIEHC